MAFKPDSRGKDRKPTLSAWKLLLLSDTSPINCIKSVIVLHRVTISLCASSKSHHGVNKNGGWGVGEEKEVGGAKRRERKKREKRRCNYQEHSLRDQLHFKGAGPHVPCSTQPPEPVW